MVALCAALALTIAGLAFVAQQRKYRFVELKSDFVATVSHELRTPLASIRLLAETLEWRLAQGAEAQDYPARIIHEADGLGFLVENLLSFNRIDKGRWVPHLSRVRLDELVATLRRDLEAWAAGAGGADGGRGRARAARGPAAAAAAAGEPGAQRLCLQHAQPRAACAWRRSRTARVLFSDNGVGIPEAEWERVFGEFYRLRGQGREVPGSGLGLALCRRIMRLHGGRHPCGGLQSRGHHLRAHLSGDGAE